MPALRSCFALLAALAVLAAGSLPCPAPAGPGPDLAAHDEVDAAAAAAFCSDGAPPPHRLVAVCPCGCGDVPSAAGTPGAPAWALRAAPGIPAAPPGAFVLAADAPLLSEPHPAAPDPVPLVV